MCVWNVYLVLQTSIGTPVLRPSSIATQWETCSNWRSWKTTSRTLVGVLTCIYIRVYTCNNYVHVHDHAFKNTHTDTNRSTVSIVEAKGVSGLMSCWSYLNSYNLAALNFSWMWILWKAISTQKCRKNDTATFLEEQTWSHMSKFINWNAHRRMVVNTKWFIRICICTWQLTRYNTSAF